MIQWILTKLTGEQHELLFQETVQFTLDSFARKFAELLTAFTPQVDLQRTFTFRNSKQTYTGIPIIAANMDTTGTFEMAQVLSKVSSRNSE